MLVLADSDVGGAVAILRRILESGENAAWLEIIPVAFTDFETLGLPRNASDRAVAVGGAPGGHTHWRRRDHRILSVPQSVLRGQFT
jgi:hypothetical protein